MGKDNKTYPEKHPHKYPQVKNSHLRLYPQNTSPSIILKHCISKQLIVLIKNLTLYISIY